MSRAKDGTLKLTWRIDSRGDHVADAPFGLYRVTFEGGGMAYRVRFAGFPIALAHTLQGAKDHALIHLNRT